MIRTTKKELQETVCNEYVSMMVESNALSEEEIQELGRLMKQRGRMAPPPLPDRFKKQDPSAAKTRPDMPVQNDDLDAVSAELAGADWLSDEEPGLGAGDTQTQMKTINIDPSEKRPYARKVGLKESELRRMINKIVRKKMGR